MKATYTNASRSPRHRQAVYFDEASFEAFNAIHSALCRRYRLQDRPSFSLLLQGLVIHYAVELQSNPSRLRQLVEEIRSRSIVADERSKRVRNEREKRSQEWSNKQQEPQP